MLDALVALSWVGRGALATGDNDNASRIASERHTLVLEVLKSRTLDADTLLPIALGAAIETEAKAMAATGQRAKKMTCANKARNTKPPPSTAACRRISTC